MDKNTGLSSRAAFSKRLIAPRIPIHGIVRVLQQVRTFLVSETVGGHEGVFDCSRSTGSPRGVETAL